MEALKTKLKQQIIEQLNLEDFSVADIKDDMPLFGEGLGLDSIDALELIVLLENNYNIKLTNPEEGKSVFNSVNSMAEYIVKNRP
ncbi:MAG: acyl carrier protein [Flavobacteriales bacterium CG_4_10_14_0_2_um_filter_32_8]|nr:MAG: acyl carrier protein [Flavobacteriales bacterium CG_4_10_14_0_2_um_filter_32_8]PJB15228.1 MAG: acyl carrier protein [Flavobacteriales bacterium CG_4_9_14_3_um_filter_32_8]